MFKHKDFVTSPCPILPWYRTPIQTCLSCLSSMIIALINAYALTHWTVMLIEKIYSLWYIEVIRIEVLQRDWLMPWVRVTCFNSCEDSLLQQLPFINTLNHIWKPNSLKNIFRTWSLSALQWLNYRWKLTTNVSPLLHYNRLLAVVNL